MPITPTSPGGSVRFGVQYDASGRPLTQSGSQEVNYGPAGVPQIEGSPLRREPNLDLFQQPLYEGGMEQLMKMLQGGNRNTGLISQGEDVLRNILSGDDPAVTEAMFREKYLPSQRRTFEEETIPGIREAMVGAGDFWSTGRANLETKARTSFAERMEAQLADLQREGRQRSQSGLDQLGDVSSIGYRQDLEKIRNILPFLNLPTQVSYLEPESGGRGGEGITGVPSGRSGRVVGPGGSGGSAFVPGMQFGQPRTISGSAFRRQMRGF